MGIIHKRIADTPVPYPQAIMGLDPTAYWPLNDPPEGAQTEGFLQELTGNYFGLYKKHGFGITNTASPNWEYDDDDAPAGLMPTRTVKFGSYDTPEDNVNNQHVGFIDTSFCPGTPNMFMRAFNPDKMSWGFWVKLDHEVLTKAWTMPVFSHGYFASYSRASLKISLIPSPILDPLTNLRHYGVSLYSRTRQSGWGVSDTVQTTTYPIVPGEWTFVSVTWHKNNVVDFFVNGFSSTDGSLPKNKEKIEKGIPNSMYNWFWIGGLTHNDSGPTSDMDENSGDTFMGKLAHMVCFMNTPVYINKALHQAMWEKGIGFIY